MRPPRVAEAGAAFECRLTDLHRLSDAHGTALETFLVLGEVVMIHIADHLIEGDVYDTARSLPILRGGGPVEYFEIAHAGRFEMRRPTG